MCKKGWKNSMLSSQEIRKLLHDEYFNSKPNVQLEGNSIQYQNLGDSIYYQGLLNFDNQTLLFSGSYPVDKTDTTIYVIAEDEKYYLDGNIKQLEQGNYKFELMDYINKQNSDKSWSKQGMTIISNPEIFSSTSFNSIRNQLVATAIEKNAKWMEKEEVRSFLKVNDFEYVNKQVQKLACLIQNSRITQDIISSTEAYEWISNECTNISETIQHMNEKIDWIEEMLKSSKKEISKTSLDGQLDKARNKASARNEMLNITDHSNKLVQEI